MKIQGNILYKFYYEDSIAYLGRTKQPLQDRIRGHLFKKPMHRTIDINLVTKIEYALFPTEADMNLYEIYYINKLKPPLNIDDKTSDELTVTLPEVDFKLFECHLWDKWKTEVNSKNSEYTIKMNKFKSINQDYRIVKNRWKMGEITENECYKQIDALKEEENALRKYLYGY